MSLSYRDNKLQLGTTSLLPLIEDNKGDACYVYDLGNIEKRYKHLYSQLQSQYKLSIHYAVKANANLEVLRKFQSLGAQVDIVSGGEMDQALNGGFSPKDVIFSGVGKTVSEINKAIDQQIKQINVESIQELLRIAELAKKKNKKIPVAFRLNPDVNPVTHPYITTGLSENKFGMDKDFLPQLMRIVDANTDHIVLRGLTMHIGSQILDMGVMEEALEKIYKTYRDLQKQGYPLESLDIGGGVGIHYKLQDEERDFELIDDYSQRVRSVLKDFKDELIIEPGRVLVGRAGVLLCRVEYIKETPHKNFAIVNTGMHHLLRPSLYQAAHRIQPLQQNEKEPFKIYDIVGPICESSDFLGKDRMLRRLHQGDYLAICDAGAYGFSMASTYNAHALPLEIVI